LFLSSSDPRAGFYQAARARVILLIDYARDFVPRDETLGRIMSAKLLISVSENTSDRINGIRDKERTTNAQRE
jgi:hypothetical protein